MSQRKMLKISTRVMYDELLRQQATVRILDPVSSLLEFTDKAQTPHLLFSTTSDKSSSVGGIVAASKLRGAVVAKDLGITVPADRVCDSYDEVQEFFDKYTCVVLKPIDNSGGNGVSTHIRDVKTLRIAYDYALKYGSRVIVQQHIEGSDIRMLVIAGTFRSAVERRPASVIGDGIHTVLQLIERENTSGRRSDNSMTARSLINTESAERHMGDKIESIPENDQAVTVVGPANLSLGGSAHEATHLVTEQVISDAEKIARRLGLGICGIDFIWNKLTNTSYFIEINGTPGVNMHNDPLWGTSSDAIERYVEWLLDPTQRMHP